jgi:hypothetical protein
MIAVNRFLASLFFVLTFVLLGRTQVVHAGPPDPPPEPLLDDQEDEDDDGVVESVVTGVSSFFFDTRSLFSLVNSTLTGIVSKSVTQVIPQWEQPLNFALLFTVSYSADGLEQVRGIEGRVDLAEKIYPYWRISLSVAVAFFPLILIANIAQSYTSGSSAPVARAEMLSSVVFALLRFGFVASSWWAANTVIKISWGLAQQLAEVSIGPSGSEIAALLTRLILKTTLSSLVQPGTALLIFYLLLFVFFLTILLITALLLSHYAFIALSAIFIVLAPIVIAVGALPFFGWLYGTWLKTVSGILLLPVANVLILKLAFTILPLEAGASIVRLATALGVIGVLISVNFTIAKTVYTPVLQAAKMAGKSVIGLGKLAGSLALAGAGGAGLSSTSAGMLGGKNPGGGGGGFGAISANLSSSSPDSANINGSSTQAGLPPGRLNALRRRAAAGNLTAGDFGRDKAGWQAVKDQARNSLAFRDPLLRGAMGAWMANRAAPVDRGVAEIDGVFRRRGAASESRSASGQQVSGGAIPWKENRVRQLVQPANPATADMLYGWAEETFATSKGPFYPEIQAKINDPGFTRHFEGLLAGTAAVHADVQPRRDGSGQSPWVVPGMERAKAVEAISRAGEFFGGEVRTFSEAIAAQHEAGVGYIGDHTNHSIHAYVRGVIDRFKRG